MILVVSIESITAPAKRYIPIEALASATSAGFQCEKGPKIFNSRAVILKVLS
jgi:hypothetical protein